MEASVAGVVDIGFGIFDHDLEEAAILILGANALLVLGQLGRVISLGEDIFQENRVRNSNRLQVLHRRSQSTAIDVLVALEFDSTDFDLGAFFDDEGDAHGGRRYGANFGADGSELPPVLGKKAFDRHLGFLHLGGIVLAFNCEADFLFLEAIEHIALGYRTQTYVTDFPYGWALFDVNVDDPALGSLLPFEADVFEVPSVPQRVEVAFEGGRVVNVTGLGKDTSLNGVHGNTAVAVNPDINNDFLLRPAHEARAE